MLRTLILSIIAILLGTVLLGAAQDTPRLYVVNALSRNITVIDMATDTVTGAIPLGAQGYRIAIAGGKVAYVTATPDASRDAKVPAQLARIDLATRRVTAVMPLEISPLAMVHVHPGGGTAYVVTAAPAGQRNAQRGQVLFVDLPAGKPVAAVQVGLNPLGSAMTPDGATLYTADWASRSISVVDLKQRRLKDTVPLGAATARALALSRDGGKLYAILERLSVPANDTRLPVNTVQNAYNNTAQTQLNQAFPVEERLLWEIDTARGSIAKFEVEELNPVYALAVSPDNAALYAYGRSPFVTAVQQSLRPDALPAYQLLRVDLKSKTVTKRYGDFGYIAGLAVSPDGRKLYLIGTPGDEAAESRVRDDYNRTLNARGAAQATTADLADLLDQLRRLTKTVTVLDAATGKTLKVIPIGALPQGSAVRP